MEEDEEEDEEKIVKYKYRQIDKQIVKDVSNIEGRGKDGNDQIFILDFSKIIKKISLDGRENSVL